MDKDIRFHERLLRLSDWIDGDPNIDEDLWPIPKQALAEIERLRAAGDALYAAVRNHDLTEAHLKDWEEASRA